MAKVQPSHARTSQDEDVWRGAQSLIDGRGMDAPTYAARKALALIANGDAEGYRTWLRVLQAVDALLEEEKGSDATSRVA